MSFPTLIEWVRAWAEAKSIAESPGALNPTPILVDSSPAALGRHQRMVERYTDLARVTRYLKPYDERLLYAWMLGKVARLPAAQLRRIRKDAMRAAREESRKEGARFRLRQVKNGEGQRFHYGTWG